MYQTSDKVLHKSLEIAIEHQIDYELVSNPGLDYCSRYEELVLALFLQNKNKTPVTLI